MRFEDITLEGLELDFDGGGNYAIPATEDLLETMNKLRFCQGNTDLVGANYDNDVYYNFYLMFNGNTRELRIQGECNHGLNDDFVWYDIELTDEEYKLVMWKLITQLTTDVLEEV